MSSDYDISVEDLSAEVVKKKGKEKGIDLIGIADAQTITENPPPGTNEPKLKELLYGASSVIVVAQRMTQGASSVEWDNRNAHHSNQIGLTELELNTLELLYTIEDHGHPSLILPAQAARSKLYDQMNEGPLSLPHAAVEAGLGTLGLNLQLLTPEYGPRVSLSAIVTTADLEADERIEDGLCEGAECGRCLLSCPGDAIDHFDMRVEDCRPQAEPWGFDKFLEYTEEIIEADSPEERQNLLKGTDSLMVWQSMIHGDGVNTGCTRCSDVCPIGDDYENLEEVHEEIPEATEEKRRRLEDLRQDEQEGNLPSAFQQHSRWIGEIDMEYEDRDPNDMDF
jgi:epoxyqueuosine reductase QueG